MQFFSKNLIKKMSLVSVLTFSSALQAQPDSSDYSSLSPLPVDEVSDSAWFTTTLTRKEIENSGAKSVPEAFALLPGMLYVSPWGSYKTTTYRGMSDEFPRRTRFEIDGVPINVASTGGVEWNAVPVRLEDIEKIVLVSNPSSVLNGDGAFNGVVKIYTVKADQSSNRVSVMGGTSAYRDLYARGAFRASDALSFQISASKQASDGDHQKVSDEDLNRLWGSMIYAPSYDNQFTVNLGIGRANTDVTSAADELKILGKDYSNRSLTNIQGNLTWVNRSLGETTVILGFNDVHNEGVNYLDMAPYKFKFDMSYRSHRKFASVQHRQMIAPKLELALGLDYTQDDEEPMYWSREKNWNTASTASMIAIKYDLNPVSFGVGFSGVHHTAYDDLAYTKFASANWRIHKAHTLGLLYSEGIRFMTNWESRATLYLEQVNTVPPPYPEFPYTTLYGTDSSIAKPEQFASWSLKYQFRKQKNTLSGRLFYDEYRDLAFYTAVACSKMAPPDYCETGDFIGNQHTDRMSVKGFEIHNNWQVFPDHQLVFSYSKSHSDASRHNKVVDDRNIPRDIVSVMTSSQFGKTRLNFIYRYFSEVLWMSPDNEQIDNNKGSFYQKGFANLSLNVQRCFDLDAHDSICLQGSAENLLEERSNFYGTENAKAARNFYLKMDYRF